MNYKGKGFRAFYHQFCVLPITKNTKGLLSSLKDFPGAKKADGILMYGYYDDSAGLTLEVLAVAHIKNNNVFFEDTAEKIRSFIRISAVKDDDFWPFSDEEGLLAKRYANKLEMLRHYNADELVEKTRDMVFLDKCRHEEYIDDVVVYLIKEGLKPEICWVKIIGTEDHSFKGILLNEPNQDFGYNEGEIITFYVQEGENKEIITYSDMNTKAKIALDDLEDGNILEEAVRKFNKERNRLNLLKVLTILRDSYVWIPCIAKLSEADQLRIEALVKEKEDNLDGLKGKSFVAYDETRLVPDILQGGDALFFPVFSTEEAMGEYGNQCSKVQKDILEVITLARNNKNKLAGIVLNAYSEPFFFDKELWHIVENMKSCSE